MSESNNNGLDRVFKGYKVDYKKNAEMAVNELENAKGIIVDTKTIYKKYIEKVLTYFNLPNIEKMADINFDSLNAGLNDDILAIKSEAEKKYNSEDNKIYEQVRHESTSFEENTYE